MGQRTQIVLKIKDSYGRVVNKVYHEQWGYMCTMPILAVNFLTDFAKGKSSIYTESFRKPDIAKLSELKALSKEDREETLENMAKTSIHNVSLNATCDTTDEYKDSFLVNGQVLRRNEETGKFEKWDNQDYKYVEVKLTADEKKSAVPLTEYDFNVKSGNDIRLFTGDNNDGLMVISVVEKVNYDRSYRDYDYDISIGFVLSTYDCGSEDKDGNHIPNKEEENQVINVDEYTELYRNDRNETYVDLVRAMFKTACEIYDVEQINTKQLATV